MKLFKYYPMNKNSLSCLINKYVWFSSPNSFNDPFDTAIIDNEYLKKINFNNEKILCLSAKNDNFLMWSHYCQGHTGFCIEFTDFTDEELLELKKRNIFKKDAPNTKLTTIRNAKQVEYKSEEEINAYVKNFPLDEKGFLDYYFDFQKNKKEKELVNLIHASSFIKHIDWAYEKEYRIINITKNMSHPPGKITGVYFGLKMSSEDKRCVGKILSPNLSENCQLYQMYRERGTYTLKSRIFDMRTDLGGLGIVY